MNWVKFANLSYGWVFTHISIQNSYISDKYIILVRLKYI